MEGSEGSEGWKVEGDVLEPDGLVTLLTSLSLVVLKCVLKVEPKLLKYNKSQGQGPRFMR